MADYPSEEGRLAVLEDLVLRLIFGESASKIPFGVDRGTILQNLSRDLNQLDFSQLHKPLARPDLSLAGVGPNADPYELAQRISSLLVSVDQLRFDQLQTLMLISSSPAFADQRFRRAIPMSVYISGTDASDEIRLQRALHELASEIDAEIVFEWPVVRGSWFKDAVAKTKHALTSKEAQDSLRKVQRGLELKYLYREQAKADLDLSKAAKNISEILLKQENGVVLLGSICGLKTTYNGKSSLVIVALTQEQMLEIANNPQLRTRPKEMLAMLKITEHEHYRPNDAASHAMKPQPILPKLPKKKNKTYKLTPPPSSSTKE